MNRILIIIIMICAVGSKVFGQQHNFAHYQSLPLLYDPSLLGANYDAELSFNHRTERISSTSNVQSIHLAAKYPLINNKTGRNWGGTGLMFRKDNYGESGIFKFTAISGSFAYNFLQFEKHLLSLGLQASYSENKYTLDGLTTGSQWSDFGFNDNLPNGESLSGEKSKYISYSGGVSWSFKEFLKLRDGVIGFSVFHFNRPDIAVSSTEALPIRTHLHGQATIFSNKRLSFAPAFLYMNQSKADFFKAQGKLNILFENSDPFNPIKNGSVDLMVGYHTGNAIPLGIAFNQPGYTIGFSYEMGLGHAPSSDFRNNATEFLFSLKKSLYKPKEKKKVISNYSLSQVRRFLDQESANQSEVPVLDTLEAEITSIKMEDIRFEIKRDFEFGFNEYAINDKNKPYLDDLADLLKANPTLSLQVIGHTDNIGKLAVNQKLSVKRAQSVVEYLIGKGVDKKQMKADGRGASEPIHPNDSDENRAKNRRVEFIIYSE